MEVGQRIKQAVSQLKINGIAKSNREVADKIGCNYSSLSSALNGDERYLTPNFIQNFAKAFSSFINAEWIMTGVGDMLCCTSTNPEVRMDPLDIDILSKKERKNVYLPLVPIDAIAGLPSIDNDGVQLEDCDRYTVPDFHSKGAQFLIRVSGNSMVPTYNNGDLLACKQITDISFFQWGRTYVLDTDQGALVKRLKPSAQEGCITCHSDNESLYPEFDLPLASIRKYFIVIGMIRVE